MRHMLISTASSSFIVSPANLTTCQDSSAIFQCKTSDDVPIFWLINNATPISAGVPYSPQTQMSTLSIPNSSAFPGASVVCYYLLQPSGNKVVSNEAFLTVIGTALALFNTCNLKLTPFFFSSHRPFQSQYFLEPFCISFSLEHCTSNADTIDWVRHCFNPEQTGDRSVQCINT